MTLVHSLSPIFPTQLQMQVCLQISCSALGLDRPYGENVTFLVSKIAFYYFALRTVKLVDICFSLQFFVYTRQTEGLLRTLLSIVTVLVAFFFILFVVGNIRSTAFDV